MVDYGIKDANLINFNEMPHKINKKNLPSEKLKKRKMVQAYPKEDLILICLN